MCIRDSFPCKSHFVSNNYHCHSLFCKFFHNIQNFSYHLDVYKRQLIWLPFFLFVIFYYFIYNRNNLLEEWSIKMEIKNRTLSNFAQLVESGECKNCLLYTSRSVSPVPVPSEQDTGNCGPVFRGIYPQ